MAIHRGSADVIYHPDIARSDARRITQRTEGGGGSRCRAGEHLRTPDLSVTRIVERAVAVIFPETHTRHISGELTHCIQSADHDLGDVHRPVSGSESETIHDEPSAAVAIDERCRNADVIRAGDGQNGIRSKAGEAGRRERVPCSVEVVDSIHGDLHRIGIASNLSRCGQMHERVIGAIQHCTRNGESCNREPGAVGKETCSVDILGEHDVDMGRVHGQR